jgi:hypothetical protein
MEGAALVMYEALKAVYDNDFPLGSTCTGATAARWNAVKDALAQADGKADA